MKLDKPNTCPSMQPILAPQPALPVAFGDMLTSPSCARPRSASFPFSEEISADPDSPRESGEGRTAADAKVTHRVSADENLLQSLRELESYFSPPEEASPKSQSSIDSVKAYQTEMTEELRANFERFPMVQVPDESHIKKRQVLLPPLDELNPKKTLILDLDETLVYAAPRERSGMR